MKKLKIMFGTLACIIISLTGCVSSQVNDLALIQSATELTISPGTKLEKRYTGEDLKDFLKNLKWDKSDDLTLVFNSQNGTIIINGKKHAVQYCQEKNASRPVILTIEIDERIIKLKEKF